LHVGQVSADDLEVAVALGEGEVGAMARGEVVEDAHAVPLGEQALHDVGPDETGTARYEVGRWFCHDKRLMMTGAARGGQLWRARAPTFDNPRDPSIVCGPFDEPRRFSVA